MHKLVLIGGGHSHAIALHDFISQPVLNTQITLITDVVQAPYSGMVPGHIAGFYSFEECHIDLSKLAAAAKVNILVAKVTSLDLNKKQVICNNSLVVPYDILSVNTGSTPNLENILGACQYGTPAKPIPVFLTAWEAVVQQWQDIQNSQEKLSIAIVGGGVGGVELALNMQQRLVSIYWQHHGSSQPSTPLDQEKIKSDKSLSELSEKLRNKLTINLFHRQLELLPNYTKVPAAAKYLQTLLSDRHIKLYLGESVGQVSLKDTGGYNLHCASGLQLPSDRIFWVTNASAPSWVKSSGLATNKTGFIAVNNYLQSISHSQIFAAGDIASMVDYQLPKAGVFAVRQGKPLATNLRLFSQDKTLKSYHPQAQYLSLISLGGKNALAIYNNIALWGSVATKLLWKCKNAIDRKFMAQFNKY